MCVKNNTHMYVARTSKNGVIPWGGLYARFSTSGMCVKNNTHMYVARTSKNGVIPWGGLSCCYSVKLCTLAARAFRSQKY